MAHEVPTRGVPRAAWYLKVCSGVLLYNGDAVVPFGERMGAARVQTLWDV